MHQTGRPKFLDDFKFRSASFCSPQLHDLAVNSPNLDYEDSSSARHRLLGIPIHFIYIKEWWDKVIGLAMPLGAMYLGWNSYGEPKI